MELPIHREKNELEEIVSEDQAMSEQESACCVSVRTWSRSPEHRGSRAWRPMSVALVIEARMRGDRRIPGDYWSALRAALSSSRLSKRP